MGDPWRPLTHPMTVTRNVHVGKTIGVSVLLPHLLIHGTRWLAGHPTLLGPGVMLGAALRRGIARIRRRRATPATYRAGAVGFSWSPRTGINTSSVGKRRRQRHRWRHHRQR